MRSEKITITFSGPQGSGKTVLMETLAKLFSENNITVTYMNSRTGTHNMVHEMQVSSEDVIRSCLKLERSRP